MPSTVRKWGNSLAIRVPKAVAEQYHLQTGSKIEFDTSKSDLTIRPVTPRRRRRSKYTFKGLWGNYKGPSPYRYLDSDPPVGKERL
jgi:antitoxin MazE